MLLWIDQPHSPDNLRKMLLDESFRRSLLEYLEDIIKEDLDDFLSTGKNNDVIINFSIIGSNTLKLIMFLITFEFAFRYLIFCYH